MVAPTAALVVDDRADLRGLQMIDDADRRHRRVTFALAAIVTLHDDREHAFGTFVLHDRTAFERRKCALQAFAVGLMASLAIRGVQRRAVELGDTAAAGDSSLSVPRVRPLIEKDRRGCAVG